MRILNHIKKDEHKSVISIINTYETIVEKDIYYVEFVKGLNNYYLDDSNYLSDLIFKNRNNGSILERSDNRIMNITRLKKYYSFIKIIDDDDKSLIGQVMMLSYGRIIRKMFEKHLNENNNIFNNLFYYIKSNKTMFSSFDDSYFSDRISVEFDFTLNIDDYIKYNTIELPIIIQRRDKITKILGRCNSLQKN